MLGKPKNSKKKNVITRHSDADLHPCCEEV